MARKSNNTALSFALQSARGTYEEPNDTTDLAVGLANCRPSNQPITIADDSYTGSVFRNADAVAGENQSITFDVKLKPAAALPAANAFVLGRLLQAAKFTEVRTATAIPASPEAVAGAGQTTTNCRLGTSASSTDDTYNGFPLIISDAGADYKSTLTAIREYTGATKDAELMQTLAGAPAANYQIPTFLGYYTDYTSAEPPVLSAKMWVDGYLTEFVDMAVTGLRLLLPTSTKQQAQFPRLEFTLNGTIYATSDEATPTIPAVGSPPFFKDGKGYFNKLALGFQDINIDFGLQSEDPPNPNQTDGTDAPEIAGGTANASLVLQKYLKAVFDERALFEAQTYHPLFAQWGNAAGNAVQLSVRHGRLSAPNMDLSGGIVMNNTTLFIDVFDRNLGIVFPY